VGEYAAWILHESGRHGPRGIILADSFNIYIDPSGHVRNANGNPIRGAKVTLYRSDYAQGPFELVPDGSAIMSPANRTNPMYSDERGYFGWDTPAGYYVVRAEKPGCTAVGRTDRAYTETGVLPVPSPSRIPSPRAGASQRPGGLRHERCGRQRDVPGGRGGCA
jgi:hypothetical protein